jgi:endonuclease/exonuclease/phosphatase family metal-dependent hydrolase
MLLIELNIANLPFWVSSVHCYPFHKFGRKAEEEEFRPIWQALAAAINNIPDYRILVAGDFNTERRDLIVDMVKNHRLIPAIDGTATHRGRAVDDILHAQRLIRRSFSVTPGLSDHAFCQAEFSIEDVS